MRVTIVSAIFFTLFIPAIALAYTIDDKISEAQRIFGNFETGKASYMETLMELWLVRDKAADFAEADAERLGMDLFQIIPFEIPADKKAPSEIFVTIDGNKTKCMLKKIPDGEKFVCDFSEKVWWKYAFNGTRAFANISGTIRLRNVFSSYTYNRNAVFKVEKNAYLSSWGFTEAEEGHARRLVEQSFPGFSKEVCKKEILNENAIQMLISDMDVASRMSIDLNTPNYPFSPISDSFEMEDDLKECRFSVSETDWEEYKVYRCTNTYNVGGKQGERYSPHRYSDCTEEVTTKIPKTKFSYKIKLKKPKIEEGLLKAWGKMKIEGEFSSELNKESDIKVKEAGLKTISIRVFNESTVLFETTVSFSGKLVSVKPEFSEKSDLKIKIKSSAFYNIYAKNWILEGTAPKTSIEDFKKMFFGILGTIIEILRAVVTGEITTEPLANIAGVKGALDALTNFRDCSERFFEAAERNATTAEEFRKCYSELEKR